MSMAQCQEEFSFLNDAMVGIEPTDYPEFVIDFDKPASERYLEVNTHFKEQLLDMEDYWYNWYSDDYRQFFVDNIEGLKEAQPDMYEANEALAELLGLDVIQTVTVSSITEVTTYCTSVVARDTQGRIAHARNLDFPLTNLMKTLVYDAIVYKDGVEVARAPSIAGFYGMYTVRKPGKFSLSFNVRETVEVPTHESILENLYRNLEL